jgi:hypothetical protein
MVVRRSFSGGAAADVWTARGHDAHVGADPPLGFTAVNTRRITVHAAAAAASVTIACWSISGPIHATPARRSPWCTIKAAMYATVDM